MNKKFLIAAAALTLVGSTLSFGQTAQAATCVKVKSVIGKNYQTAQDIWRAQGFAVLPAKDGTGRGRSAWIDSNWFVTGQTPKAGSCVKKYSGVRATILKYTD
ncbi:MAG: PASTA domain-containing protein [Rhodoluna sp.]|nr:PASTA domain-containing protein [Rhodoluna sp.]